MSPFDGIHRGPHTRGDAFSPTRRPVEETSVDPSPHSHHRMSDGIALAPPGNRWSGGHRAALCVSIDVDRPYGELNDQPPANWYDISQTDYDPTGVDRLLHLLADVDVRGTFCWVGRAAEDEPDRIRRAVAEGFDPTLPPVVNLPPAKHYDDDVYVVDKAVTPQATLEFWREDLDVLRAEGGPMCLTLHPFVTGRPGPSRAPLNRLTLTQEP